MMAGRVHVIGAGLAGLCAAVRLVRSGQSATLYEAAGAAGGRCRSYVEEAIGRRIDNGNHLVLSGNIATRDYLAAIGAGDRLVGPAHAEFPFLDLQTGLRWRIRPNAGRLPWWIFSPARRVPGSRALEYLRGLRLRWAAKDATVAGCLGVDGVLYRRFWEPLAVAVLNAGAEEGAASLLWPVIRETFARGEAACRPRIAARGLSDTFVDPAIELLAREGAELRFRSRLRAIVVEGDRVVALRFTGAEKVPVASGDRVVLAVPPAAVAALLPDVTVPCGSRAIVNGHFLLDQPADRPSFLGLVGGLCQWLFVRGDVASITVSAADRLVEAPAEEIARRMWKEVALALGTPDRSLPAFRIVKEKRATFAQVPAEIARRPGPRTAMCNLFLAGDWTDTGLPATIEGSLRSAERAQEAVLGSVSRP